MKNIKIIAPPPGQAPVWVREKWVGVVLPLSPEPAEGIQLGVRGGKAENAGGFEVRTADAITELRKTAPDAAAWWEKNVPLAMIPTLVFSKAVCEPAD